MQPLHMLALVVEQEQVQVRALAPDQAVLGPVATRDRTATLGVRVMEPEMTVMVRQMEQVTALVPVSARAGLDRAAVGTNSSS